MALGRPDLTSGCNLAKRTVRDAGVRIAVAHDVEGIERIKSEAHRMPLSDLKILKRRHVRIEVAGAAHCTIARRAECVRGRNAKRAYAVVHSSCQARSRRRIGAVPATLERSVDLFAKRPMDNLELAILIDARIAVAIGVVARAGNSLGESRIGHPCSRDLPA